MTDDLLRIIHERKPVYRFLHRQGADLSTIFPVHRNLRNAGNNVYVLPEMLLKVP